MPKIFQRVRNELGIYRHLTRLFPPWVWSLACETILAQDYRYVYARVLVHCKERTQYSSITEMKISIRFPLRLWSETDEAQLIIIFEYLEILHRSKFHNYTVLCNYYLRRA